MDKNIDKTRFLTILLESMSEYFDFGRDANGKLTLKNKKAKV